MATSGARTLAERSAARMRGDGIMVATTAALVSLAVIALVAVHPLGIGHDYPNHLAVSYLEANLADDPGLQRFYQIAHVLQPNLAMDLLVAPLGRLVGIQAAGTVFLVASILLPPLAGLLLARTLGHGRVSWINLLVFSAIFNGCLYWGLNEYLFAAGLALLLLALWIRMAPSLIKFTIFTAALIGLALMHALGPLLFGYMVLLFEINRYALSGVTAMRQRLLKAALFELPALCLPLIFMYYIVFDLEPQADIFLYGWSMRWAAIISAFSFGSVVLTVISFIVFIMFFYVSLRQGYITIRPECRLLCIGMAGLALATPYVVFGIELLHIRFGFVFVILLCASSVIPYPTIHYRALVTSAFCIMIVTQFVSAYLTLSRIDSDMREVRSALSSTRYGSRILVSMRDDMEKTALMHAAGYAVIDRGAFVPGLFIRTTPLEVTEPVAPLTSQRAAAPYALAYGLRHRRPRRDGSGSSRPYVRDWPEHFDYVLFLRDGPGETLSFTCLAPVAEHPRFVLYEVERSARQHCRELPPLPPGMHDIGMRPPRRRSS